MLKSIKQAGIYLIFTAIGVFAFLLCLRFFFEIKPAPLEVVGITSNIWGISLIRKQNVIGWMTGLISTGSIGAFSIVNEIYGQALLQLAFFLPSNIYAIYTWTRAKSEHKNSEWLSNKQRLLTLAGFVIGLVIAFFVINTPNMTLRIFDILALSFVLTGQVLMVLKKKECWLVFIPGNIIATVVFFMVGGYLLAGLNLFFCINSLIAFTQWLKES